MKAKKRKTKKDPKKHMGKKKKILMSSGIALLAISVGICLYFPISTAIKNSEEKRQEEELSEKLDNCLKKAGYGDYDIEIACYEQYNVPGYSEKIAELREKSTDQKRNDCLVKAWSDYKVTEEEKNNATTVAATVELLMRYNSGYDAEIKCYQQYGNGGYQTEINNLSQKIADNNNLINSVPGYTVPEYTIPDPTDSPASHNYYAPTVEETAPTTPTLTCDDYRSQYYTNYQNSVTQTQTYYNNAISNASMQCSGQGGCPAVTSLKNQLEAELSRLRADYESNMTSVGCTP